MAATTKTMKIVRVLAGKGRVVYNDRLDGGVRSIKVAGWTGADYDRALEALLVSGLEARQAPGWRGQVRLHVVE